MAIIRVDELCKQYKVSRRRSGIGGYIKGIFSPQKDIINAVSDIGFEINEGEIVGYVGPNGAGKSTTIKMLTGILVPTSGLVEVDGIVPYKSRKEYVKKIGVVFGQRSQLWWDLPVIDSYELLKDIYKIPQDDYNYNLRLFSDVLELDEILNKPVRQLSLGQRMRCEIAASFLHNPKVVFLDEPTIGLDIVAKEKIREIIKTLNRKKRTTIILTTHDMSDIEELCERIIIIDHGRIAYDGSIQNIRNLYGNRKILTVDFKDEVQLDAEKLKIELLQDLGKRKQISFYSGEMPIEKLFGELSQLGSITDLEIQGTPIEEILKEIYSGRIIPSVQEAI